MGAAGDWAAGAGWDCGAGGGCAAGTGVLRWGELLGILEGAAGLGAGGLS